MTQVKILVWDRNGYCIYSKRYVMIATEIRTKKDLPTNPQKLLTYSWNLTLASQQLKEKYRKLLGNQFGKSSEKLNEQYELDALRIPVYLAPKSGPNRHLIRSEATLLV